MGKKYAHQKIRRVNARLEEKNIKNAGQEKAGENVGERTDGNLPVRFVLVGHDIPMGDFVHEKMRNQDQWQAKSGICDF